MSVEEWLYAILSYSIYVGPFLNGLMLIVLTALVTWYLRRLATTVRRMAEAHEACLAILERQGQSNKSVRPLPASVEPD